MSSSNALRRRYGHAKLSGVVFTPSEGWWVASIPGTPGAYSQGKTRESAYSNLLDAVAGLEQLRREGLIT